jgi:hypothetical protein
MSFLESFKEMLTKTEQEVQHIEQEVIADAKSLFEKARADAIASNAEVSKLKADLQIALARSRDLHQAAVEAAQNAVKSAEDDLVKLRQAVVAHTSDFKAQASQIVVSQVTEPVNKPEV